MDLSGDERVILMIALEDYRDALERFRDRHQEDTGNEAKWTCAAIAKCNDLLYRLFMAELPT